MTEPDTRPEQYWRRIFEGYGSARDDDAGIAGWSKSGLAARYRQFMGLWKAQYGEQPPPGRWLDAGCGAGTYTRFLAAHRLDVTAIDYSQPTARKARERSEGEISWAVADATQLPFASGCLDGILCFGVMQALSSPGPALAEFRRVLRPGGMLWIDALNAECIAAVLAERRRRRLGKRPHLRYDRVVEFESALQACGFDDIHMHWMPVVPERLRMLQPLAEGPFGRSLLGVPPLGSLASLSFLAVARTSSPPSMPR